MFMSSGQKSMTQSTADFKKPIIDLIFDLNAALIYSMYNCIFRIQCNVMGNAFLQLKSCNNDVLLLFL